jgi:hypothetical protein
VAPIREPVVDPGPPLEIDGEGGVIMRDLETPGRARRLL